MITESDVFAAVLKSLEEDPNHWNLQSNGNLFISSSDNVITVGWKYDNDVQQTRSAWINLSNSRLNETIYTVEYNKEMIRAIDNVVTMGQDSLRQKLFAKSIMMLK